MSPNRRLARTKAVIFDRNMVMESNEAAASTSAPIPTAKLDAPFNNDDEDVVIRRPVLRPPAIETGKSVSPRRGRSPLNSYEERPFHFDDDFMNFSPTPPSKCPCGADPLKGEEDCKRCHKARQDARFFLGGLDAQFAVDFGPALVLHLKDDEPTRPWEEELKDALYPRTETPLLAGLLITLDVLSREFDTFSPLRSVAEEILQTRIDLLACGAADELLNKTLHSQRLRAFLADTAPLQLTSLVCERICHFLVAYFRSIDRLREGRLGKKHAVRADSVLEVVEDFRVPAETERGDLEVILMRATYPRVTTRGKRFHHEPRLRRPMLARNVFRAAADKEFWVINGFAPVLEALTA